MTPEQVRELERLQREAKAAIEEFVPKIAHIDEEIRRLEALTEALRKLRDDPNLPQD